MTKKQLRATCAFCAVMLASALLLLAAPGARAGEAPESIEVLNSLAGDTTVVDGSVVYVDFWASWCVPCRASFPWMAELLKKYGDKGLQIIAINVDKDHAAAEKFLKATKTSLPVIYDPEGKMAKRWNLQTMPSSFVYGRDGKLRMRKEGFVAEETGPVEALIRELLEEKPK